MAEKCILKIIFWFPVAPLVLLAIFLYTFHLGGFRKDLKRCIDAVDKRAGSVPDLFGYILFAAEDHRTQLHAGVDPVALARAVWVRLRWRRVEGASTVEQQFVRTVLQMHARSFRRKVREQTLAIGLARARTKIDIATAYLSVAYYGTRYVGTTGLKQLCGKDLNKSEYASICGAIARLKYPEPTRPSVTWMEKYRRRVQYIIRRQRQTETNGDTRLRRALNHSGINSRYDRDSEATVTRGDMDAR